MSSPCRQRGAYPPQPQTGHPAVRGTCPVLSARARACPRQRRVRARRLGIQGPAPHAAGRLPSQSSLRLPAGASGPRPRFPRRRGTGPATEMPRPEFAVTSFRGPGRSAQECRPPHLVACQEIPVAAVQLQQYVSSSVPPMTSVASSARSIQRSVSASATSAASRMAAEALLNFAQTVRFRAGEKVAAASS